MLRGDRGTERAGRGVANRAIAVGTTSGAGRNAASGVQLDVRGQVARIADRGASGLAVFEGKFVGRSVNLAEVVDTSIGLRGGTGLHEVRNRDGSQQTDDGHDDHDFNQGKTRLADVFIRFHFVFVCYSRRERTAGGLYIMTVLFTDCLLEPHNFRSITDARFELIYVGNNGQ